MSKSLKITIITIILIIIILAIVTVILLMQKRNIEIEETPAESVEIIYRDSLVKENSKFEFFDTKTCIDNYFNTLSKINKNKYDNDDMFSKESLQEIIDTYKEEIYSMLDEDYIKSFSITLSNMDKSLSKYYETVKFEIDNMYVVDTKKEMTIFVVYGNIIYTDKNKAEPYGLIIKEDTANLRFSIYPYEYMTQNNYTEENIKNTKLNITIEEYLEAKDANNYNSGVYEDEYVCTYYFEKYKTQLNYNVEDLYNSLDKQYREKRFGTLEDYKKYVKENKEDLLSITLAGYGCDEIEGYERYICKDQYDNIYLFKQEYINQYTLILDTYTIESADYIEKYNLVTNQEKVITNISKFFEMINTKDYKVAYEKLSTEYKQTYFKTESDFENYIKQKLFNHCQVKYNTFTDKISGIFTYNVTILDKSSDKKIEMNFAMELLEGTDYRISFEIIE